MYNNYQYIKVFLLKTEKNLYIWISRWICHIFGQLKIQLIGRQQQTHIWMTMQNPLKNVYKTINISWFLCYQTPKTWYIIFVVIPNHKNEANINGHISVSPDVKPIKICTKTANISKFPCYRTQQTWYIQKSWLDIFGHSKSKK